MSDSCACECCCGNPSAGQHCGTAVSLIILDFDGDGAVAAQEIILTGALT